MDIIFNARHPGVAVPHYHIMVGYVSLADAAKLASPLGGAPERAHDNRVPPAERPSSAQDPPACGGSDSRRRNMMSSDTHGTSTIPATGEQQASPPASTHELLYPQATRELAEQRARLAPGPAKAFRAFSQSVFTEGALPTKTKQLIAVAVAHVTQCPYCIRSHTGAALRHGGTAEEIMEAIWVAAEMRAGGAYAHSALALDVIAREQAKHAADIENSAGTRGAGIASSMEEAG
ncbi:MAG TPA: carboxymuconolactone decarboxylase family protein [Gemmatimonadales bacterium]|nr:carboxymuconolactone decarboxylase family protein [Gemmatimonadales bacterium]